MEGLTFEIPRAQVATCEGIVKKENLHVKIVKGYKRGLPSESHNAIEQSQLRERLEERALAILHGEGNRERFGRRTDEELDDLHGKLRMKKEHRDLYIYIYCTRS